MPVGPATLTVGDVKTATVLGFDQNGQPFPIDFSANPVSWSDDNTAAVAETQAPDKDTLLAAAPGSANLTATCAGFTASVAITVVPVPAKLSSIQVSVD